MNGRNTDIGKITALRKANWSDEQIAKEMGIAPDEVEKAISGHMVKGKPGSKEEEKTDAREKKMQMVTLTSDQLKDIYEKAAAIGAKEGLKAFEQERKKEYSSRPDRRLRNTKLLLRNYHMLKEHAENSVFGRTQMEESAFDILESMMSMYNDEIIVQSIKNSATRTAIIVSHIETMFGLYAAYCDKSINREIDMRRYEVIWDMYMAEQPLTAKEIAEKQHLSKDTVYADMRIAIERLTALIFGLDGLKLG